MTLTQSGGNLRLDGPEIVLTGGVNADGTFTIGGIASPVRDDGVKTGQVLMLMEGKYTGNLIIGTMRVRMTAQATDGRTGDLEQVVSITMQKED